MMIDVKLHYGVVGGKWPMQREHVPSVSLEYATETSASEVNIESTSILTRILPVRVESETLINKL